jgi:hypothetical protein
VKTANLQKLIEALRNELQQYGEMLALLDHQHELIRLRGADDISRSIAAINSQGAAIQTARQNRQFYQQEVASALGHQPNGDSDIPSQMVPFSHLLPSLPPDYRPLVAALVQENNQLLERVRCSAHQNQTLLRQSLDSMQRFITRLAPGESRAGSGHGSQSRDGGETLPVPVQAPSELYEAIV